MCTQQTNRKKPFLIFLTLGFLLALFQIIAGSFFEGTSDVSFYVVLLYGLAWDCLLYLYSGWALVIWLKRHYRVKDSWSSMEKAGIWLQLLSLPILLVVNAIGMALLFVLNGIGRLNFMEGYVLVTWICLLFICTALIYIGSKVYSAANKDLGGVHILWGCALVLLRFSFSIE